MNTADRVTGAIYAAAIGDAMGAPVEGMPSDEILKRFNCIDSFLPVINPDDTWGIKGGGRITDDTLLAEALIRTYIRKRDHIDAYDYKELFLEEITKRVVWVPEKDREMAVFDRLFWPEKYPWIRMYLGNVDPRTGGIGNIVNCGAAIFMYPVGLVNAGDPKSAYGEAVLFASAHNESFALEAAAVMAACTAESLKINSSISQVLETALDISKAGTHDAIESVLGVTDPGDSLSLFIKKVREAVSPWDQKDAKMAAYDPAIFPKNNDISRPSQTRSIEELPVALAALKYGGGDFHKTIQAAVFYGRDCDSSASMAGALFGGLFGCNAVPRKLCLRIDEVNRRSLDILGDQFFEIIQKIAKKDKKKFEERVAVFNFQEEQL